MNIIKIFLASSIELKKDRRVFEIFIARKNNEILSQNVYFELIIWEDFLDAIAKTRKQDEYNEAIRESSIFIMLFATKVGKYTEEEFDVALKSFRKINSPVIFTFFKDSRVSTKSINKEMLTLLNFKQKLDSLGHFYTLYKNVEELQLKFNQQLQKLDSIGTIKLNKKAKKKEPDLNVNISNVKGKENVIIQGIKKSPIRINQINNKKKF